MTLELSRRDAHRARDVVDARAAPGLAHETDGPMHDLTRGRQRPQLEECLRQSIHRLLWISVDDLLLEAGRGVADDVMQQRDTLSDHPRRHAQNRLDSGRKERA